MILTFNTARHILSITRLSKSFLESKEKNADSAEGDYLDEHDHGQTDSACDSIDPDHQVQFLMA